jgi:hypothetical protein
MLPPSFRLHSCVARYSKIPAALCSVNARSVTYPFASASASQLILRGYAPRTSGSGNISILRSSCILRVCISSLTQQHMSNISCRYPLNILPRAGSPYCFKSYFVPTSAFREIIIIGLLEAVSSRVR